MINYATFPERNKSPIWHSHRDKVMQSIDCDSN